MSSFNLPPGVTESMIPGNDDMGNYIDKRVDELWAYPMLFYDWLDEEDNPLMLILPPRQHFFVLNASWLAFIRDNNSWIRELLDDYEHYLRNTARDEWEDMH